MTFGDREKGERTMGRDTLTKFRFFGVWQDQQEEAWLREMGRQGWHLSSLFPLVYTFARGEPRDDVYRLDFIDSNRDVEDYLQLFRDAGWEHLGNLAGWQYFRKPYEAGEAAEIHTDAESKVQKYRRVRMRLAAIMPAVLATVASPAMGRASGVRIFVAAVLLLMVYALVRVSQRIRQLKRL
jgi:hypothetical protein